MKLSRILCVAIIATQLAAGCATRMHMVEDEPLQATLGVTLGDLRYNILEALDFWGWKVLSARKGSISARRQRGRDFLEVEIVYGLETFSIRPLRSSASLRVDTSAGRADEWYNVWMRQLEFGVQSAAMFARPYRHVGNVRYPPEAFRDGLIGHVFTRNYVIGEEKTSVIGEAMVRVKDYAVLYNEIGKAVVVGDWTISGVVAGTGDRIALSMEDGHMFSVVGSYREEEDTFYLVLVRGEESRDFVVSVDSTGSIASEHFIAPALEPENLQETGVDLYRLVPHPEDTKRLFRLEGQIVEVDRAARYTNYALIYQGTTGQQIHIGYREYSPDDLARAAFYQDLVYRVDEPAIRFRGLHLRINEATNEEIVFTVVQDDVAESRPE